MTAPICPLCRRPYWIDGARMIVYCAAEPVSVVGPSAAELLDCRSHALRVAALVAPVVEAAEEIIAGSIVDRDEDEAALAAAFDAMRDGLARLGAP